MIEQVRTWQTRDSGNSIKVTSNSAWRCISCNIYFQNKTQAHEHKCKLEKK